MNTKTLPVAKKPRRIGWILRLVLVLAVVSAGAWYALPTVLEFIPGQNQHDLNRTLVTTSDVNLRNGPGTNHEVILVVPNGSEIASDYQIENGFTRAEFNGHYGWISADYLRAPGRTIAQSVQPSVQAETAPEPTSVPENAQVAVTSQPEPTAVPTYAPISAESTQVQPDPQPGEKWIEVNRTTRTVTLHNGEIVVAQFDALIGKDSSPSGYYSTAVGTFYVHVKEKSLVETPFADGVYLTDFVGFDPDRSNGFHSPVRDSLGNVVVTGGTTTLGCVRLAEGDAIFLFDFAEIGMRVEVHD